MMGGSCSARRRHRDHGVAGPPRTRVGGARGRPRGRSFSSAVGRLCGDSEDGSSDDDSARAAQGTTKRAARHSVDAEIPNQSIAHLYPPDDNYDPHPTDPTLRRPKPLADLCLDAVCRRLPDLDGALPPGLPQEVVDRLVDRLASRGALNGTTLGALRRCELHALSLARCRGARDAWLLPLGGGAGGDDGAGDGAGRKRGGAPAAAVGRVHPVQVVVPPRPRSQSASPLPLGLGDGEDFRSDDTPAGRLPEGPHEGESKRMDDFFAASFDSRSTSSFLSASSTPYARGGAGTPPPPLLQSAVPPPGSPGSPGSPTGSSWSSLAAEENDKGAHSSAPHADQSLSSSTASYADAYLAPSPSTSGTSSTLALLDLRGSSRLTDRGLLQLARAPLLALEEVRLDGCHGLSGRGLLALSGSARLRTLSLANCRRLTDEAVVNVGHLGALTSLNLGGCRCLTDRSLAALAGLTELRKLDVSQCDLMTDEGLSHLAGLDLLDELNVGWCRRLSDEGLAILAAQPRRAQTLATLRLARCAITDAVLEHLEQLERLAELDLNGCTRISSERLGRALGRLPRLAALDVSHCPGILRASWQGRIDALTSLELCHSGVRDTQLAQLRDLPRLEELNLDSCPVGDRGLARLVEAVPNLTTLDLADTDISDTAMSQIAQLKKLRHLSLFYCNISDRGLKHIATLSSLERLNLDSRDIGDYGLRCLRKLPLKSLDLFSSRVTGCVYLSEMQTLTSLELCGGGIADAGCAHIATLVNLASLNLSQNELITNRGAASLAALAHLKALNLSNTAVTSEALRFFGGLLRLQSLALYGNGLEDSPGLSSLQSELPSLRCLRLNNTWDEDGVIEHSVGSIGSEEEEFDDDEEEEEEEEGNYDFGNESEGSYQPLNNDDGNSAGSSDFQDAYDEETVDASQGRDIAE